jgi:hypothetical protein
MFRKIQKISIAHVFLHLTTFPLQNHSDFQKLYMPGQSHNSNRRGAARRTGSSPASAWQDGGFRWSRQCIQRDRSKR